MAFTDRNSIGRNYAPPAPHRVKELFAASLLFSAPAHAISTEAAPVDDNGNAVADPDEGLDGSMDSDSDALGNATIEIPPIDLPDSSSDYSSPDSDDDMTDDPANAAPQDGSSN